MAADAGFGPPDPALPFRYIELGCGSGVTLNGLAAACPQGEFIGVDFNARNIAAARAQAAAAGLANVSYIESAFSALDPQRLAPADYIACNGTYSWIDGAEKTALIDIVGAALRDGGLLYLGYVTLGRAAIMPMWHALRRMLPGDGRDSLTRVKAGIDLLAELRDHGAAYLRQNAEALTLVSEIESQRRAGDTAALENLAHNLFAEGLRIELLDEVVAALAPAGLSFCGSATPFLNDADLALDASLRARHDALPSRVAQELLKDLMRATRVRADVFIRADGPDAQSAAGYVANCVRAAVVGGRAETWQQLTRADWTTYDLSRPVIRFVFDRLADGADSLAEATRDAPFPAEDLRSAYRKLIACPGIELGLPGPAPATLPERVVPACRYNALALDAARAGAALVHLAAPTLGSCVPLSLPGSLLVGDFCRNGVGAPVEVMHARLRAEVANMPAVTPAAVAQFADPQVFAQMHRAIIERGLLQLLQLGALAPG